MHFWNVKVWNWNMGLGRCRSIRDMEYWQFWSLGEIQRAGDSSLVISVFCMWDTAAELLGWKPWFVTLPSPYTRWRPVIDLPFRAWTCDIMDWTWGNRMELGLHNSKDTVIQGSYRVHFNPNTPYFDQVRMTGSHRSWVQLSDGLEVNWKQTQVRD